MRELNFEKERDVTYQCLSKDGKFLSWLVDCSLSLSADISTARTAISNAYIVINGAQITAETTKWKKRMETLGLIYHIFICMLDHSSEQTVTLFASTLDQYKINTSMQRVSDFPLLDALSLSRCPVGVLFLFSLSSHIHFLLLCYSRYLICYPCCRQTTIQIQRKS